MIDFLKAFSNIMITIAVISLFCWFFGSVLGVLPGKQELIYHWADKDLITYSYYNIYFENPAQNLGHGTICNLGVFAESPGYSGFLTYGLLIELALRQGAHEIEKHRDKTFFIKIIIYSVTILSTASSKGIISILIILLVSYWSRKNYSRVQLIIRIITGIVVVVTVGIASYYVIDAKLATESGLIRLDHLTAALHAWMNHPIIGNGYQNIDAVWEYTSLRSSLSGISMGIGVLLAYGGLWFAAIYALSAVFLYKSAYFQKHKKSWMLVIAVLLLNLAISNSGFSDAYVFMIAAAYASRLKQRGKQVQIMENNECNQA